jgi:hypothetical protein
MEEYQMIMMGELTFFLGILVKQMKQSTFIHQAKYTKDLIKKFNMADLKPISTLMSTTMSLDLVGFSVADFVGCGIDRMSTSNTCHFLGSSLIC